MTYPYKGKYNCRVMKSKLIQVKNIDVRLVLIKEQDYISLTDMARFKNESRTDHVLQNWLRNRNTVEFIGLWEMIHNPDFKPLEFEGFKKEAGLNSFVLTPQKWISTTNAKGLISKSGRYNSGTFAHRDIAFEFGAWLSAEFKLYLIKEFQRLKEDEAKRLDQGWNIERYLAKVNYRIHTDAIKANLIPPQISIKDQRYIYASEADILNLAVFGMTAAEWRMQNPKLDGNIRDYAELEQLIVLRNIEAISAVLIEDGFSLQERLQRLNLTAISQMESLFRVKANTAKLASADEPARGTPPSRSIPIGIEKSRDDTP